MGVGETVLSVTSLLSPLAAKKLTEAGIIPVEEQFYVEYLFVSIYVFLLARVTTSESKLGNLAFGFGLPPIPTELGNLRHVKIARYVSYGPKLPELTSGCWQMGCALRLVQFARSAH